jgi:hypothetical protein
MDLEKMTIKELTELYNSKTKGKVIKKFESKAQAIARIKKVLPKKDEQKVSKVSIIRSMFEDKGAWTREEIMSRTGFDARNAHAAMNILKNAARTKNPIIFTYDRKTRTYELVNFEISDN